MSMWCLDLLTVAHTDNETRGIMLNDLLLTMPVLCEYGLRLLQECQILTIHRKHERHLDLRECLKVKA